MPDNRHGVLPLIGQLRNGQEKDWRTFRHLRHHDIPTRGAAVTSARLDSADELLTASQAGDYLQTGERFIRRLIAERRIPYVKLGKFVRDAAISAGRVH